MDLNWSLVLQSVGIGAATYYAYCYYDTNEENRMYHYVGGLVVAGLWYRSGMKIPIVSNIIDSVVPSR